MHGGMLAANLILDGPLSRSWVVNVFQTATGSIGLMLAMLLFSAIMPKIEQPTSWQPVQGITGRAFLVRKREAYFHCQMLRYRIHMKTGAIFFCCFYVDNLCCHHIASWSKWNRKAFSMPKRSHEFVPLIIGSTSTETLVRYLYTLHYVRFDLFLVYVSPIETKKRR